MIGPRSSRAKRRILFSASSLALLAASNVPALAQNDNTSHAPPAAAVPQPPAVAPAPVVSNREPSAPAGERHACPATTARASDARAGHRRQCLA